jgi:hypothetical protein
MQFIIARYNENVSWANQFDNKIIYNKGNTLENSIQLSNVGREAHTYLYHIINNYNNLAEFTCFLQGNPFDHSPNLFNDINDFKYNVGYYNLASGVLETKIVGCIHEYGLPVKEHYNYLFKDTLYNISNKNFLFGAGAQFIVSKEIVHLRPLNFYENLIKLTDYSDRASGAWTLERLWSLIFSYPNFTSYEFIEHNEYYPEITKTFYY